VSDQPLFWKGNQDPSITETITSNGLPVDLTGMSVKFKMRAVNSSTLKVDAAVSNTPDATGVVRYDWSAPDVNTAGQFLMWWEVTDTQGHTQDMSEAVIEFRAHTPLTNGYVELEQFKSTAELTGSSFADQDIQNAIVSASRWIDYETSTKFWPDTVDQTRYFTANGASVLRIDDLISLTTLTTDTDDNGTFDYTWTVNTDFVLEPKNAVQNGFPYNSIRRLRLMIMPGPPGGGDFTEYHQAMQDGLSFMTFTVRCEVAVGLDVAAQQTLDNYLDVQAGSSVKAAVESTEPWAGW
jgi:hypothetical protein